MESYSPTIKTLLEWINTYPTSTEKSSRGSFISSKISIKDYGDEGRGLVATSKVFNNEEIIKIPHSLLLNAHSVIRHISAYNSATKLPDHYSNIELLYDPQKTNDDISLIYSVIQYEEMLTMSSFQLVSLFLCLEAKRRSSFWRPFLDSLPTIESFQLTPLVWEVMKFKNYQKYLDLLPDQTGTHAAEVYFRFQSDFDAVKSFLSTKLNTLHKTDALAEYLDEQQYLVAWMCINSRCLYMELRESKDSSDNFTMAPYVDFINHTDTDQCSLKIDGRGFHVSTTTTYEQGNQMYLSYGPHSNSFLLCEYGFTIPSNQWNDLDVSPVIIKQMNENQIEFLKANDYYGDYTIRKGSGVSYRTEIALAVLQEPQPQNSRKLNAYIQGLSEGEHYSAGSRLLLEAILTGPVKDYENSKHLHSNGKQDQIEERILRCIGSLYEDLKDIVDDVL